MKLHEIPKNTKVYISKDIKDNIPNYIEYTTKEDKTYFAEEFSNIRSGYHMYSKHMIKGVKQSIPSELYSIVRKDGYMMLVENSKVNFYVNLEVD